MQSRYYDPVTCKFINIDEPAILFETAFNPLSVHLWSYCDGNPVIFIDPTGYYNVNKAIEYAKKWWNKRNSNYYSYSQDCANFVSQCLYAGGLSMSGQGRHNGWHSYKIILTKLIKMNFFGIIKTIKYKYTKWDVSASWSMVTDLKNWLKTQKKAMSLSIHSKKDLLRNLEKGFIKTGQVAFLSTRYNGELTHAVLIGKVTKKNAYYFGHTSNRNGFTKKYGLVEYFDDIPFYRNKPLVVILKIPSNAR